MSISEKKSSPKSETLFAKAKTIIPGGVNSPVRAFGSVGTDPRFIARGSGSRIWDEDGQDYLDYVCSWGALILGHAHPAVVEAVQKAAALGLTFGAATAREVELAELICKAIPSLRKLRLVSSGTEATMTAIRLARAFTKRSKILKFEGCYHGHADPFLVKAGSGLLTFGNPSSAGVPASVTADTIVASYNDASSVEEAFQKFGPELACVIVEPVAANMGVVTPNPGFLELLRKRCSENKALLIFDEVITGFRFHFGGYQSLCGIVPDLTTLGKIIGGGLPIGAVGGRSDIMEQLAPLGPVYQAGTLSGNPVATAAGLATLNVLQSENPYPKIERLTMTLVKGIKKIADDAGKKISINQAGSMCSLFFNPGPVDSFERVMTSDREPFKKLFNQLLDRGIYLPPSPFEAWFVSAAHTDRDLSFTLEEIENVFRGITAG